MAVSLKTKRRNDNVGYHLIQSDFSLLSILFDRIQHKSDDLLIVRQYEQKMSLVAEKEIGK